MTLLTWCDETMLLGVGEMDDTHKELVDLLSALDGASGANFVALFDKLVGHTEEHFANESRLMNASSCPARQEHEADHRRVLAELKQFQLHMRKGRTSFAREYLRNRLPEWFEMHLATMDSVLSAHLQRTPIADATKEV